MASVLVVEDEPDVREGLCEFLAQSGYHVLAAPDGLGGITSLLSRPPKAIVLDLRMPNMDGADFLETIRSYLRFQFLPVIVWTAVDDAETLQRVRQLGVHVILKKPVDSFPEVLAALDAAIA